MTCMQMMHFILELAEKDPWWLVDYEALTIGYEILALRSRQSAYTIGIKNKKPIISKLEMKMEV